MTIRPATEHDLETLVTLGRMPELLWGEGRALLRRDYEAHLTEGILLVAEEGGTIVGFVLAEMLLNRGALLWTMGVAPDARGLGVGTAILDAAERAAFERGAQWIVLYAATKDPRLATFYTRHGYEPGQGVVEYVKLLDPTREIDPGQT